jgi:hypothetical protein
MRKTAKRPPAGAPARRAGAAARKIFEKNPRKNGRKKAGPMKFTGPALRAVLDASTHQRIA